MTHTLWSSCPDTQDEASHDGRGAARHTAGGNVEVQTLEVAVRTARGGEDTQPRGRESHTACTDPEGRQ